MDLKLYNEWTGTEGYGNSIKKENIEIKINFKGVKTYEEFKNAVKGKKSEFRNSSYKKLDIFLHKLETKTGVDPVKYLYYLYYEQELSTIVIYDRLHELGGYNNKKKDTFGKMFKKTFGWKLRDNTNITETGKKRIRENTKNLKETSKDIKQQKQEELFGLFASQDNVNLKNELQGKNQLEKLNYFFEIYGFKDKNISLKDYLVKFKELYGLKNLTDVINKLLKEKGYDLKLSKGRFSELFRK